jgi:hypothetical protein
MLSSRLRKLVSAHCMAWCLCGVLLTLCQPFLAVHFRCDGWEDEPAVRIRTVGTTTQFEADDRADHPNQREITLFAQSAARVDASHALQRGLDILAGLVLMLLPLTIALVRLVQTIERHVPLPVPTRSGAPPPTTPWRRLPPKTAPPLTT